MNGKRSFEEEETYNMKIEFENSSAIEPIDASDNKRSKRGEEQIKAMREDSCRTCEYFILADDIRHGRLNKDSLKSIGLVNDETERLKEQLVIATAELAAYKQKYADEVEKRLLLLERMDDLGTGF